MWGEMASGISGLVVQSNQLVDFFLYLKKFLNLAEAL